jgi:hypothetical protein
MHFMEKRTANHEGGHGSLYRFEPLGGLPRQLGQAPGAAEELDPMGVTLVINCILGRRY